jgi:sec-independent protein translocase protein TatA
LTCCFKDIPLRIDRCGHIVLVSRAASAIAPYILIEVDMGLDSFWHWIILLVVVLVIFGTGKLAKIGPDLGDAMRGFKNAMHGDNEETKRKAKQQDKLQADPPPESDSAAAQHRRDEHDSK